MYVTVHVYRARAGEEDAIVALHEDWQRHLRGDADGCLRDELLRDARDPRRFMAIAHYESQAAARAVSQNPEYTACQRRLESLCQVDPEHGEYEAVIIPGEHHPR